MPYRIVEMDADLHGLAIVLDRAVEQQRDPQFGDLAVAVRSAQRRGVVARHNLDAVAVQSGHDLIGERVGEVARLRAIAQRIERQHRDARGRGLGRRWRAWDIARTGPPPRP